MIESAPFIPEKVKINQPSKPTAFIELKDFTEPKKANFAIEIVRMSVVRSDKSPRVYYYLHL